MRRRGETIVLIAVLMLLCGVTAVRGQEPSPSPLPDSDELKTQEQILDELKLRRAQVKALEEKDKAQTEQIKTLQELAEALRERGDFYKEAAMARSGANVLEAERDRIRREQIAEYRTEINYLRQENDKLRSSRDRRTLFGLGIGAVLGGLAAR